MCQRAKSSIVMFLDNLSMGNHSNRFIPFIWPYIRASISSLTVSMTFESFQFGSFFSPSRGTFPSPCALSSFYLLCCKQTTNRSYNILFRLDTVAPQIQIPPLLPSQFTLLCLSLNYSKL